MNPCARATPDRSSPFLRKAAVGIGVGGVNLGSLAARDRAPTSIFMVASYGWGGVENT